MKRVICSLLAGLFLVCLSSCTTMDTSVKSSELQTRVDKLETKIQKMEKEQMDLENLIVNQVSLQTEQRQRVAVIEKEIIENPSNKDIQIALKGAGIYKGSIDGKIGPQTREAIMEFQKNHGLKVDGVVGRNTWEILSEYYQ